MSLYIDHKYIKLLSNSLKNFKRKSAKLYNCRCPICLDSKKSKYKSRGYFYIKDNRFNYKCHNCLVNISLPNLLKRMDISLYKQYVMERFSAGENGHSNYQKPDLSDFASKDMKERLSGNKNKKINLPSISSLPDAHRAKLYISLRKIPKKYWKDLYYAENFKEFVETLVPDKYNLANFEPRIVIPFYNEKKELIAIQGRLLTNKNFLKYITIKLDEDAPKIFGMDRINKDETIYITEGPFDSLFLNNCVAAGGADINLDQFPKSSVFVFDNERRNIQIVKRMRDIASKGYKIFVWPKSLEYKDINECILNGITITEMKNIIKSNTFDGLNAMTKIEFWGTGVR